jgi:hypothetical protein
VRITPFNDPNSDTLSFRITSSVVERLGRRNAQEAQSFEDWRREIDTSNFGRGSPCAIRLAGLRQSRGRSVQVRDYALQCVDFREIVARGVRRQFYRCSRIGTPTLLTSCHYLAMLLLATSLTNGLDQAALKLDAPQGWVSRPPGLVPCAWPNSSS